MTALRAALVLLSLGLAAMILSASGSASFTASFGAVLADAWGRVAIADLYLGFLMLAAIIALVERRGRAIAWIVALFVLGNVVGALWLAFRLPLLVRRLG